MATDLGKWLNSVRSALPCPKCGQRGPMAVYELAVRWGCGHYRALPPFRQTTTRFAKQSRRAA
jgi:ribosomal protein S27AE